MSFFVGMLVVTFHQQKSNWKGVMFLLKICVCAIWIMQKWMVTFFGDVRKHRRLRLLRSYIYYIQMLISHLYRICYGSKWCLMQLGIRSVHIWLWLLSHYGVIKTKFIMEVKPKLDWMWLGGQHVTFRNIGLQLRSTTPLIWFSTLLTNMKMFSTRWPPPLGLCKINVDGALFPTKKLAGIGVVIRDQ